MTAITPPRIAWPIGFTLLLGAYGCGVQEPQTGDGSGAPSPARVAADYAQMSAQGAGMRANWQAQIDEARRTAALSLTDTGQCYQNPSPTDLSPSQSISYTYSSDQYTPGFSELAKLEIKMKSEQGNAPDPGVCATAENMLASVAVETTLGGQTLGWGFQATGTTAKVDNIVCASGATTYSCDEGNSCTGTTAGVNFLVSRGQVAKLANELGLLGGTEAKLKGTATVGGGVSFGRSQRTGTQDIRTSKEATVLCCTNADAPADVQTYGVTALASLLAEGEANLSFFGFKVGMGVSGQSCVKNNVNFASAACNAGDPNPTTATSYGYAAVCFNGGQTVDAAGKIEICVPTYFFENYCVSVKACATAPGSNISACPK